MMKPYIMCYRRKKDDTITIRNYLPSNRIKMDILKPTFFVTEKNTAPVFHSNEPGAILH